MMQHDSFTNCMVVFDQSDLKLNKNDVLHHSHQVDYQASCSGSNAVATPTQRAHYSLVAAALSTTIMAAWHAALAEVLALFCWCRNMSTRQWPVERRHKRPYKTCL